MVLSIYTERRVVEGGPGTVFMAAMGIPDSLVLDEIYTGVNSNE